VASNSYDAIVVGSGLGGLTCAGYLAASGQRVLVIEQHDVAGGNSHVFRRRRAYEFEVGVHYLGDCGADGLLPAILDGLGLRDRVAFHELDRDCFDRILLPGLTVEVPVGWARYRERLRRALPGEAAGLDTFVEVCRGLAAEQRTMLLSPGGVSLPGLLAASPNTRAWGRRTLADLFDHCGLSARARTVLAAQSPNYGAGPAEASLTMHAIIIDHYLRGAYVPRGGGQTLAAGLVEVLEAYGGTLLTRARVARILVDGGRATGVRLADGTEFPAPLVVSNADYRRTVLELVGPEHFSRRTVTNAREAESALPLAVLYIGLRRELAGQSDANLWWYDTDDIESYYRWLGAGWRPDEVPFLFVSFSSSKDPDAGHNCPPGHANFQLLTLCPTSYAAWGVERGPTGGEPYRRNPRYRAAKQRLTAAMLHAAERVLGRFTDDIEHIELATPLTQERYTRSTAGTPFGIARWGNLGTRPGTTTGIAGLYLVGQSARYDNGITGVMIGGATVAGQILGHPVLYEAHSGKTVGDPVRLPSRPAGWDPLVVSRGLARRDAPGLARWPGRG
jgi:phytoene dehydrogenase-like protein